MKTILITAFVAGLSLQAVPALAQSGSGATTTERSQVDNMKPPSVTQGVPAKPGDGKPMTEAERKADQERKRVDRMMPNTQDHSNASKPAHSRTTAERKADEERRKVDRMKPQS